MPRSDWRVVAEFILRFPCDLREQAAMAQVLPDIDIDIDIDLTTLESSLTKTRALKLAMAQALLAGRIRLVAPTA